MMKIDIIPMNLIRTCLAAALMTVLCMPVISCESVFADKTIDADRTGSVTIRYFDDVDARTPVYGAQFTFYKIDDSRDTTTYTDTTNRDGILRITDMKLGRYRVVETSPAVGHKASASFLMTIPMTENNEWIYDVTLEPKASLDLTTTTKSVYTPGNTSGAYMSGRTGTTAGAYGNTGTSSYQSTAGSKSSAGRSSPVETGDKSNSAFWLILSLIAAIVTVKTAAIAIQKPE